MSAVLIQELQSKYPENPLSNPPMVLYHFCTGSTNQIDIFTSLFSPDLECAEAVLRYTKNRNLAW
jgi:hypothetical protein